MRNRLWSQSELEALKQYVDNGVDVPTICKSFPYRTSESVIRRIRRLKTEQPATQAQEEVVRTLIDELKLHGPRKEKDTVTFLDDNEGSRELEVCIMDPHFGMQCTAPDSDHPWSMEEASDTCLWAIDNLLAKALHYAGNYSRIIMPFGNDFLHADNIYHTTTKGTNQPEMLSWHDSYKRGIDLAIRMVDLLRNVAPVKIYQIPGNHSVHSDYTMGLILQAYYHNDPNVEVDASSSPYKFHRFGKNLIGYEHGHSVSTIRLAALMANERPKDWSETSFREWHLGDQHRKGSSVPAALEEQGVSVEYITGLTPPNYWHRVHAFNYQKRGAVAYVWNEESGQEARFNCNLDPYTGKPT